ncbi:hypothetical protein Tco_1274583 [Tanacetum coccineum]
MASHRLNPLYAIKECMTCGSLYTRECCSIGSLGNKILVPEPESSPCCAKCGTPVDGPYCRGCALLRKKFEEDLLTYCGENETSKDFEDISESSDDNTNVVNAPREPIIVNQDPGEKSSQGAHYGYNCPPKVLIISNPEQCNQTIAELPQTLPIVHPTCNYENENSFIYDSKPNSSNDFPSVLTHPQQLQFETYLCELCGNNAHYGYDCPPQFLFIYEQELCYNQNFNDNYFPQNSQRYSQQYLCCANCGGPHETFQCQPMNEDYCEQNSCYYPNLSPMNDDCFMSKILAMIIILLLMEQMATLRELVDQAIQKKEEEKRIAEEQAAKDRSWKIPICYNDDEDNTIAITPVLPIEEPDNSLSMGDEHLDTIPETESDEVIKSSVENLIPIPSESEGIPDKMCDVPLGNNPTPLNALNEHYEIVVNSDDDNSSSDDDSYENIDYVDASPPDVEIVSLEVVEIVDPEVGRIDDDILLTIKDDILREKLLNVNLLIAKIDALRDNPTPSSEVVIKSTSTFPNLFLEGELITIDSLLFPESETFRFNLEEISSGSPTTHYELSLPDYKAFYVDNDHFKEKSSGNTTTHVDFSQYDSFIFDLSNDQFPPADRSDFNHEDRQKSYADRKRKPMEFEIGDRVMLKVSPWKGVVRFGKRGKLNPRYVGPFKVLAKVGKVAYRLELPQELSRVHHTFHVSNLKKCYADEPLVMPLEGIHVDDKLQFVEEPIEIMEREIKRLKQSRIPLVKVRWNSRRGPEFTWEREDSFKQKYPQLFTNRASSSTTRS